MGPFQVGCRVENHIDRAKAANVPRALVDTGSEYTWIPEKTLERIGIGIEKKDLVFTMANGQQITRSVGFAIIGIDKHFTIDEVVFAEPGGPHSGRSQNSGGTIFDRRPAKKEISCGRPDSRRLTTVRDQHSARSLQRRLRPSFRLGEMVRSGRVSLWSAARVREFCLSGGCPRLAEPGSTRRYQSVWWHVPSIVRP